MNFLKKLTGLFVFVLAIAGAVAVSRYFSGPRPAVSVETPPPPPPAPPAAPARPPQFDAAKSPPPELAPPVPVYFKVRLVTLDFSEKKSHVTLELERHRASPAPERVWAWVSFYAPEDGGRCAAEPVEVRRPFARGDRATVVVESDASGCARPRAPGATLYARANVSAASAEAARLDASRLFDDLTKATPVVVAGATTN
jgi:hypothetical protein